ncbi:VQ domain-containing protein [Dioscorea alata]|uniref:VQ domain-containing protein n=1 Tax=Dioscorea alata TaxID=55571 RepID=A0ACB7WCG9_DIOAL|nr:VQ domain-containing protein [Dioscorea alata]
MEKKKIFDEEPWPKREPGDPRQSCLKISGESYKMKKPPPQRKPPVIIYTVPPKVIRTEPSNFMSVVQRHTGVSSSSNPGGLAGNRENQERRGDQAYGGMSQMENIFENPNENNMPGLSASENYPPPSLADEWDGFYQFKD